MGLINYTQLEDGTSATANAFNIRYGQLFDLVNGNLDSANLATSAVEEGNIAPGAVTNSKVAAGSITPDKFDSVAFRVKNSAEQTIVSSVPLVIDIDTVDFDYGDNFNTSTNRFVAPFNGIYQLNGRIQFKTQTGLDADLISAKLHVNGSETISQTSMNAGGNNSHSLTVSDALILEAGDYVELVAFKTNGDGNITANASSLSGFAVGAITT